MNGVFKPLRKLVAYKLYEHQVKQKKQFHVENKMNNENKKFCHVQILNVFCHFYPNIILNTNHIQHTVNCIFSYCNATVLSQCESACVQCNN